MPWLQTTCIIIKESLQIIEKHPVMSFMVLLLIKLAKYLLLHLVRRSVG